jgi:hypothetical protein
MRYARLRIGAERVHLMRFHLNSARNMARTIKLNRYRGERLAVQKHIQSAHALFS